MLNQELSFVYLYVYTIHTCVDGYIDTYMNLADKKRKINLTKDGNDCLESELFSPYPF